MLNQLPTYLASALLITLIIEISVALLIGLRNPKDVLNVALVNVLTNPIVVFSAFISGFIFGSRIQLIVTVILEIAVLIKEALIYRKTLLTKRINPFVVSLILNGVSFFGGEIINRIIY